VIGRIAPFAASNLLFGIASLLSILLFSRLLSAEAYGYDVTMLALAALLLPTGPSRILSTGLPT
jgi:predicted MFS family arabinose efflux permease